MTLPYIKLFGNFREEIELLTMEERGRLLTAMLEYAADGEVGPDTLAGNARILFPVCRGRIDRDGEAYERVVRQNRANGAKGGRPRKNPAVSDAADARPPVSPKTQIREEEEEEEQEKDKDGEEDLRKTGGSPARAERSFSQRTDGSVPTPPELSEVKAFCARETPSVDADLFWHHYQSTGWTANGRPLLDWRARAREWEAENRSGRGPRFTRAAPPPNPALNYEQREYRDEDFKNFFLDLDGYESPGA